jgi:hypothetical protein
MDKKDCIFYIDKEEPAETRKIHVRCIKCAEDEPKDGMWFWYGSKKGYGPFLFQCERCEIIIHKPEEQ